MNDKKVMVTFAKWLKTKKKDSLPKEWMNVSDEQLADELAKFLQTEDGVKQLTPFIKEFETDMQQQTMFASGGIFNISNNSFRHKNFAWPNKKTLPLYTGK